MKLKLFTGALTRKALTIAWITLLVLLAYSVITIFYFQDIMPSDNIKIILLFGCGVLGILESVFEGKRFSFSLKNSSDFVGMFTGIIALTLGIGMLFNIELFIILFEDWIGHIFLANMIVLFWEGFVNRR